MGGKHAPVLECLKQLVHCGLSFAGELTGTVLRQRRDLLRCWYDMLGGVIREMAGIPVRRKYPVATSDDKLKQIFALYYQVPTNPLSISLVGSIDEIQEPLESRSHIVV